MSLQVGGVNHHSFRFAVISRQSHHHLGEDALFLASLGPVAFSHSPPPFPTIVERLVRAILPRRIAPPQAIAIDENIQLRTRRSSTRGLP
jgi:hypothetical protein